MVFNGYGRGGGVFTLWLGRVSPHRKMFCHLSLKTHIFTLVIIVSITMRLRSIISDQQLRTNIKYVFKSSSLQTILFYFEVSNL